ncbi:MAG: glycerol kinase GlpK [Acidimicrobiia bacterium]|nr:glycerol kinase GlpK [Acidimicrobiia bacterium]
MYVGAIDQGTTSTRFVVVDESGAIVAIDQMEHLQIQPRPGWVEHDAAEIWANTERVIAGALAKAGIDASQLAGVGITNQRETTLLWDAVTGEPVHNAIVWQDTRTDRLVDALGGDAGPDRLREITGLPLATYFAGPKVRWLLDEDAELAERAASGGLRFGTMDSWVLWNLTGRHVTDVTNASRTLLMDLGTLDWSDEALDVIGVPRSLLPEIVPSVGTIGTGTGVLDGVPIAGVLGDQQAALFGQTCFTPGEAKNTYGTGCFMLLNTGTEAVASEQGLLTTVGYQIADAAPVYALEGSVAIAGAAVQWLRDNLRLISSAPEVEELATSVEDHGGVYFVPAFSGLFAPHWRSDARGAIVGLTRYAEAGHIARATLEAVAFQTRDVLDAMRADSGVDLSALKVDGGMVSNETLMQFQADILGVPVIRPTITESTALGAAYAAGLATGFWGGLDELSEHWEEDRRFEPTLPVDEREERHTEWQKAITRTLDWA